MAFPATTWFPGTKYVDWIGVDGYFSPSRQSFRKVLGCQLRNIRRLTREPIYLAETGITDSTQEAHQIAALFAGIWRWHTGRIHLVRPEQEASWSLGGKPLKDAASEGTVARLPTRPAHRLHQGPR